MFLKLLTLIDNYISRRLVIAVVLVTMMLIVMVWLIDTAITKQPQYEGLTSILKVFNTLLPALLEGMN